MNAHTTVPYFRTAVKLNCASNTSPRSLLESAPAQRNPLGTDNTLHHVCICSALSDPGGTLIAYRRLIIRDDPQAASKYIADYVIGVLISSLV